MTVVTCMNGTLFQFARLMYVDRTMAMYFGVYTVLSYVSISCYMTLVKRFGGVAAVLLTTARKAMTLVLSFLLFPKGFSWLYVHGSLLVLGAVMIASIFKKMGIGRSKGGEYQGHDVDCSKLTSSSSRGYRDALCKESPRPSSLDLTPESLQLQEVDAILNGISKRVYV